MTPEQAKEIVEEVAKGLAVPKPELRSWKPERRGEYDCTPPMIGRGKFLRVTALALEELTPNEFRFGVAATLAGSPAGLMAALVFAGLALGLALGLGGFWLMVAKLTLHPLLNAAVRIFLGAAAAIAGPMLLFAPLADRSQDRCYSRALLLTRDLEAARGYLTKRYEFDWSGEALRASRFRARQWVDQLDKVADRVGVGG